MAVALRSGRGHLLSAIGRTLARSFCYHREHAMSKPLHIGVSNAVLALRHLSIGLELRTPVLLPASTSPVHSSQEDQERLCPSHPSDSGVSKYSVVSRTSGHEHLSFDTATPLGRRPVAAAGQGPAPDLAQPTPLCLENEQ